MEDKKTVQTPDPEPRTFEPKEAPCPDTNVVGGGMGQKRPDKSTAKNKAVKMDD